MHILGCVHLLRYLERTFLCLYDYSWWVGLDWTFVHVGYWIGHAHNRLLRALSCS